MLPLATIKRQVASHPRLLGALTGLTLLLGSAGTAAAGGSSIVIGP